MAGSDGTRVTDRLKALVEMCIAGHVPAGHLEAIRQMEEIERQTLKDLAAMVNGRART